jgi:ADP-ribose pyrophosphatase
MTATFTDLTERCISSQTIASGGMLTVKCDQVSLPNGNTSQREYILHPGAVVVVPILPSGNVVLEKQFRYPLHQVFIELPAGKIDTGEDTLVTGHMYLALGLSTGEHRRDEDEHLEVFEAGFEDCLSMIQNGQITDGKTIIALLMAEKYLSLHPHVPHV